MDELARFNQERWEELSRNRIAYSQPALGLDLPAAREMVDEHGLLGEVRGKNVLCLASGGGQQSAAFGLLGARVTVLDLTETQLARDQEAAAHYGLQVRTVQGDMRDLSCFGQAEFDVVWHAHSINFVPDARQVFREVRRVLRPGGLYHLDHNNPFTHGMDEREWTGKGYLHKMPDIDGEEIFDSEWEFLDEDGNHHRVRGPREFRHALSTLINGLVELGFTILGFWEGPHIDEPATPGSWEHYLQVAQPNCTLWARLAG